ncbi:hypothetical protein J2X69_004704 [Algoriphagus sp. 4150]|uniref:hypothetical protein n=1 Tax=Algoriphagus sp. 4150 TaxID=2817756 RepID=UPI00285AAB50|nr:hypothetical protein [Algoriphagus sp. 4150]MDR7132337.1 hypothetical protein [Algoriphagus sp. 4150]
MQKKQVLLLEKQDNSKAGQYFSLIFFGNYLRESARFISAKSAEISEIYQR